ncbi:MAG: NAD-glutamate dehydrogenase domain-containing protein, partial [Solirubrobacteraceae bacterium]
MHDPTLDTAAAQIGDEARRDALEVLTREFLRRGPDGEAQVRDAVASIVGELLRLTASRGAAPVAVHAFNPTIDQHGYATPGSVVQTSTPDQPFIVDTIVERLRGRGLRPRALRHPIVGVERDAAQRIVRLGEPTVGVAESLVHVELERRLDATEIASVEDEIRGALTDARTAVAAFDELRARMAQIADALSGSEGDGITEPDARARAEGELGSGSPSEDADEVAAFLRWLADDNAVLLGAADHALDGTPVRGGGLGILADGAAAVAGRDPIDPPAGGTVERIAAGDRIVLGHTMSLAPVHRRVRMEDIAVRVAGPDGEPLLRRIVLLFGSRAYATPSSETPLLRGTLLRVLHAERLLPGSHDWKALVTLFDGFPKEELFALSVDDLRRTLMALVDLTPGEVALRARTTADGRAATVVLAVPRPSYDAMVRDGLSDLVRDRFGASDVSVHEVLGEGDHVQLHLQAYNPSGLRKVDADALERAAAMLARSWDDRLREALTERVGGERGPVLAARWAARLPGQYKAGVDPTVAVRDVEALERLTAGAEQLVVTLKHEANHGERPDLTRVAFVVRGDKVELSRAMPILEHLGLHVVEERPTRLRQAEPLWVQDFGVLGPDGAPLDLDAVGDRVAATIDAVWRGETESDPLNRLVVTAGLSHDRLAALRAYRSYRQRIGSRFTERYQNEVIVQHPRIVERLVRYFELRFGADTVGGGGVGGGAGSPRDEAAERALREEILELLDDVPQLDHDRILRNQLQMVDATYRTNAYLPGRQAIAFKLKSAEVPAIPQPTPLWEIYVHSPDVEGIHLRGGMIARGGLRWSDRADFRTEVLGLMRAQMVKNAVIVPAGAKGGFLLRDAPTEPAALRDAVREGYVRYISALLDVTDDLVDGEVVHPAHVRVLDGDDHYLVVAADKGTASFSDVANGISTGRGFWLGDAFASGGSAGYDHKALGITARGAWESVKRHFRERGI